MSLRRAVIRITAVFLALVGGIAAHDAAAAREREWTTRAAVAAIEEYREHVSPRLKGRIVCRFEPSCSLYGLESVKKHGAIRGGWKAASRIARCNPWTPMGTLDPP